TFIRWHPIIRGTHIIAVLCADERRFFSSSNVVRVAPVQVAARVFFLVKLNQCPISGHQFDKRSKFFIRSITPHYAVWFSYLSNSSYPLKYRPFNFVVPRLAG